MSGTDFVILSTCPQSKDLPREEYVSRVETISRWSEAAGCDGILVYTDNGLVDPWLVAQLILQATERLAPLVAVQPAYMHPFAAAKMVATLAALHERRLLVNMVAGGFRNDLAALSDTTPHDERYDRLVEYASIMRRLLAGERVTFDGAYYSVTNLRLAPSVPAGLQPGFMVSGSSPAGRAAARAIGATPVKYPKPPGEELAHEEGDAGVRVGVIAREQGDEAWQVAHERFPPDRKGQLAHQLAMKVSDSHWHRQLSRMGGEGGGEADPYWLWPFENFRTYCPYLVGSYERVALELQRYMRLGFSTFILDIPHSEEELHHTRVAFNRAATGIAS
jgi:alkanesulfonate monooxygenase